jgi:malonyl-CoA O-methyltransferase
MPTPSDTVPPSIDPNAAARWQQAAPAASPWLHEEVARRMQERLQWIKLQPDAWCHWDAVRGGLQGHELVRQHYPKAQVYVHESAQPLRPAALQALGKPAWSPSRWLAPARYFQAPPDAGVQMLWANMALHLSAQPMELLAQWQRALATDGFLMFSCLGPDTVLELRELYRSLGWPVCGHDFTDMHDWGDMLVQAGFAEPVMDMERIVLTYETPQRLLQELRGLGRNLHPARFAGLRGRDWQRGLEQALTRQLSRPEHGGRLALTFEVIYGHALKPAPRLTVSAHSSVSLDEMRAALARGKNMTRKP